jgi:pSer/pThr/pTyr-binding forkhead associated (FHA) protein
MQALSSLKSRLGTVVDDFRKKYPSFDESFSTYMGQYGEDAVEVYEPFKINGTIDPVVIILGRTTPLFYKDSRRLLSGSLNSVPIESGNVYVMGRRKRPDSKLIVWSAKEESEVEQYDSRIRIIPSRIHAAIFALEDGTVLFADLGSSSGSILVGETSKPEPFITLYAPPRVDVHRVPIESKYTH